MSPAVLLLVAATLGPVVLRGSSIPDPRPIQSIDERGVLLSAAGDAPRELVGWERIKIVTGDEAERAKPFTAIAENAWRARERLLRGDSTLARPLLESLAAALREANSSAAMIAHAGLARARADAGDFEGAVEAWERAAALHAAGLSLDAALARAIRFDAESGLITDLPVFWIAGESSTQPAGEAPLATWRRAVHGETAERAEARSAILASIKARTGDWTDAWGRAALGRSYLAETDADLRIMGILELLQIPARFARQQPILRDRSLAAAIDEAAARGDESTADILRAQRRDASPTEAPDASATPADQLASYLQASGLTTLLISHLDSELRLSEGIVRTRLAQRLARLYAELLESGVDPKATGDLESRARALLADVPDADSLDLRLTLARSAYTRAEQQAERWRLRMNPRAEADAARRVFVELEKQEETTTGTGADRSLLAAALVTVRRTRSMGHFLAGWCAYYAAELEPATAGDAVARAERHFGWLLNARSDAAPTIDRVPESLLAYEHVARAALGVAMCHSLKGQSEQALRWLDLVASAKHLPASVSRALSPRKMLILARAGSWGEISALVDPRGGGSSAATIEPTEARLLAVLALEARRAGADTTPLRPLIILAMESLAGRGELQQVLDLASRYFDRVDDIAPGGFLPAYIRGLREFDRATREREASSEREDRPPGHAETRRVYALAMKFFDEALASGDAAEYDTALPGVTLLAALARFYSAASEAELTEAADRFSGAAQRFDERRDTQASRARLLAVRSLDAALEHAPAAKAITERRRALIDEFLLKHPTHTSAATLLYERALSGGRTTHEAALDLLSIPESSPVYGAAHYQASRLLYDLFHSAPLDAKSEAAAEFLAVAEPLLERLRRDTREQGADAVTRAIATARRILDCLMRSREADPIRARRAHDYLSGLASRGVALPPGLPAEIEYRAVQIALLEGDRQSVDAARGRLREIDPALAEAAGRAVYQHAADRFESTDPASVEVVDRAREVMRLGAEVIAGLPPDQSDLSNPAVATLHATIARAAAAVFAATRDTSAGAEASAAYARLLAVYPNDSNFLRGSALHAETMGDGPAALAAWRGLLSGLPQGSPEWFDAMLRILEVLAASDPDAARAALARHRVLFPDLGPEPWRARILEIERRLGSTPERPAP